MKPHYNPENKNNYNEAYTENGMFLVNGTLPNVNFKNYDFKNRNTTLINNLEKKVLNEQEPVKEYSIIIDSKDRNIELYPSPFSFKVTFSPLNSRIENPSCPFKLENVKYIILEKAILPYYFRSGSDNGLNYDIDTAKSLVEYPYNILTIKEFAGENTNSTNEKIRSSFELLYYRKKINKNDTHYYACGNNTKIFSTDNLKNVDKLTLELTRYSNMLPDTNFESFSYPVNYKCICYVDSSSQYSPGQVSCPVHFTKHPLCFNFQVQYYFKIGVYEPHFNKKLYH